MTALMRGFLLGFRPFLSEDVDKDFSGASTSAKAKRLPCEVFAQPKPILTEVKR